MAFENISGATSATYTTPALALADSGAKYRCVVTNAQGSATSNEATVNVSAVTAGTISGFSLLAATEVTPGVTSFATGNITPTAGRLLLAKVDTSDAIGVSAPLPNLVNSYGITWQQIATQQGGGGNRFRTTWFQATPSSPSAGPVTVTYSVAPASNGSIVVLQVNTSAGAATVLPTSVVQSTLSVVVHDLSLPTVSGAEASVAGWFKGSIDSSADAYPNWAELSDLSISTRRSQVQGAVPAKSAAGVTWSTANPSMGIAFHLGTGAAVNPESNLLPSGNTWRARANSTVSSVTRTGVAVTSVAAGDYDSDNNATQVTVTPGTAYTITATAVTSGIPGARTARIAGEWISSTSSVLSTFYDDEVLNPGAPGNLATASVTAPSGAAKLRIILRGVGGTASGEVITWSNLSVVAA